MRKYKILTINPGSTSTKVGVFENENLLFEYTVRHNSTEINKFNTVWEQYSFRKQEIVDLLQKNNFDISKLNAVVGRGGLIKPIPSGIYAIDEEMIQDARIGFQGQHASNLGCVIAYSIGWEFDVPSYIVDPPAVDDFEPLAKISGYAGMERSSLLHALNIFATARKYAKSIDKDFKKLNLIVAHLGGGISVAAVKNGRAINANNGIDEGPFSPERSGSLPLTKFIDLCLSGKYTKAELKKIVAGKGGLVSYFNTNKAHEVEKMAKSGSPKFKLVFEAMAYQISQEIGARSTNLKGDVDAIILTGGIAHSEMLTGFIEERVKHIAPITIFPGELELEALATGAVRALNGDETVQRYKVRVPKVGIFYWTSLEVYSRAINTIEDTFKEKGYLFRKHENNIEFVYGNGYAKEATARKALDELVANDVELIIAVGSLSCVTASIYLKNTNIPLICTVLHNVDIIGNDNKNMYSSCYGVAIDEQLENTIFKLQKNIKKIGVMYKIDELQSNTEQDEIKTYCEQNKIECVSYDIQNHGDFANAVDFFETENVDWVFLGTVSTVAGATSKQLEIITKKFPTVCALAELVRKGGLISYHISTKEVSTEAGKMAIKLLNNLQIDNSSEIPKKKTIIVNKEKAKLFNFTNKIKAFKNLKYI